jgi:hypothetical protein
MFRPLLLSLLCFGCVDYGVTRERKRQTWTQPPREGGVDILWVVDDSLSMTEEQGVLAEHADAFISMLANVPVDFQLGVISTDVDVGEPGALLGPVLSTQTSGLVDAFADQVLARSEGSRDERGFQAALLAADPGGVAAELHRAEADLELVFFTDEDDHSGMSAQDFVSSLEGMRPRGQVVVNAIAGDLPEGCASREAAADPAEAYAEAQVATDGLRESICAADYDALLERIALAVLGLEVAFALTSVPEPDSIEVRVDGALIHERSRHGWRYEAGDNTVVFDGYAVPPPGAFIELRYYPWQGTGAPEEAE